MTPGGGRVGGDSRGRQRHRGRGGSKRRGGGTRGADAGGGVAAVAGVGACGARSRAPRRRATGQRQRGAPASRAAWTRGRRADGRSGVGDDGAIVHGGGQGRRGAAASRLAWTWAARRWTQPRFRSCRNFLRLEPVRLFRLGQLARADNKTGPTSGHLPAPPTPAAVASRQKNTGRKPSACSRYPSVYDRAESSDGRISGRMSPARTGPLVTAGESGLRQLRQIVCLFASAAVMIQSKPHTRQCTAVGASAAPSLGGSRGGKGLTHPFVRRAVLAGRVGGAP